MREYQNSDSAQISFFDRLPRSGSNYFSYLRSRLTGERYTEVRRTFVFLKTAFPGEYSKIVDCGRLLDELWCGGASLTTIDYYFGKYLRLFKPWEKYRKLIVNPN